MKDQYLVERMTKEEVDLAIQWAAKEGWNPGLHDADCFYKTDPHGFFAGKLAGEIIAAGSAVIYDKHFAFCGFYIVEDAYRHKGYGLELTKKRLEYIGSRNAGIDGVTGMLNKYARLGYKLAHNNARYQGNMQYSIASSNPAIVSLKSVSFSALSKYDQRHFPAKRDTFLQCWINQPGAKGCAFLRKGKIAGYGLIRPCIKGFKIGPLFADSPFIAEELFINLTAHAYGEPYYLDIPECNENAKALARRHNMEKVFETARMYLKGAPKIKLEQIYGITSFELG
ncbi:acetyltransferase, GNAT family (plasmid) [Legionella adelaidensis]|uniref:Acetyltransferase, GNAT family n=1 Tax=Legionella adelaidensis TaxID=45056 RepID=A0A0W0R614_9GAMM|nr:GNAT family N-acetyltransferase [Legionella adelaidensis]KTC66474.1 GNAT family acetyltransferase [Legionella adelaidensis]VEH86238.1 acetyltransferase, GNAT family [Legionella adelaidensis]